MPDANIRAVITAEDRASGVLDGFASKIDVAGISFTKLTTAFATGEAVFSFAESAIQGISNVISDVISKAEAYQTATSNLQISIDNNTAVTDKNINSLLKQADALSNVTEFSDKQVVAADSLLAIHKLNQTQIAALVPHLADMAKGIAAASGEMPDLATATNLVSKAIGENDIEGFSGALRRAGVFLNDHQKQILKTGDLQEKLGTITDVLSVHFQGLSTADTAQIKIAILNNQIEKAQESIGLALLPTIAKLADKLATFVESDKFQAWLKNATEWLSTNLPKALNWITKVGIPDMKLAFEIAKPVLEITANILKTMFDPLITGLKLIDDLRKAIDGLNQHKVNATSIFGDLGKLVLPAPVTNLAHTLHVPGFASGIENFQGGLAYVHQGEVLTNLAPGTNVIPKDKVKFESKPSQINLTIQAGAYMGTPADARKYAQLVVDNIKDIAGKKNMTASQLLGA